MANMTRLSVVIPSLNDARLLEQCLADLAAQTRQPDEIIVVDNGSADDTADVARAAGARVVHESTRGVLFATTAGFNAAEGDIVGRLDTDSRPDPHWAARIIDRFDADPTLHALTGTGSFYDCNRFWQVVGRGIYLGGYFWFIGLLAGTTPVFGSNFALRRDAWERIRDSLHFDDPRTHDDLEISFALTPDMGVEFDRMLRVQVSGRPFSTWGGFQRRASWAFRSIGVWLREEGVFARRRRWREGRRARRQTQLVNARTSGASPH